MQETEKKAKKKTAETEITRSDGEVKDEEKWKSITV